MAILNTYISYRAAEHLSLAEGNVDQVLYMMVLNTMSLVEVKDGNQNKLYNKRRHN